MSSAPNVPDSTPEDPENHYDVVKRNDKVNIDPLFDNEVNGTKDYTIYSIDPPPYATLDHKLKNVTPIESIASLRRYSYTQYAFDSGVRGWILIALILIAVFFIGLFIVSGIHLNKDKGQNQTDSMAPKTGHLSYAIVLPDGDTAVKDGTDMKMIWNNTNVIRGESESGTSLQTENYGITSNVYENESSTVADFNDYDEEYENIEPNFGFPKRIGSHNHEIPFDSPTLGDILRYFLKLFDPSNIDKI